MKWILALATMVLAIPAVAAVEILPLAVGNKWEYDVYKVVRGVITSDKKILATMNDYRQGSAVYEVTGVDEKDKSLFDYKETTTTKSVNGSVSTDVAEIKMMKADKGLLLVSTSQSSNDEEKNDKQVYDPPLFYYNKNVAPGVSWEVGIIRDENVQFPMAARGINRETVTVPAGTFKDCLKIVYSTDSMSGSMEMWQKQFNVTSGLTRSIYWIAEGVGVVKEVEVSTSTSETTETNGKTIELTGSICTVCELKPGYTVK